MKNLPFLIRFGIGVFLVVAILLCSACQDTPVDTDPSGESTTSALSSPGKTTTTHSSQNTEGSSSAVTTTSSESSSSTTSSRKISATTRPTSTTADSGTTEFINPTGLMPKTTDPASTSQKSAPKTYRLVYSWDEVEMIRVTKKGWGIMFAKDDARFAKCMALLQTWEGTYTGNRKEYTGEVIQIYLDNKDATKRFDVISVSADFTRFASCHQKTDGENDFYGGSEDLYGLSPADQEAFRSFLYNDLGFPK